MLAARLLFAVTAVVFLALPRETCNAKGNHHCSPSSCGSIQNISYPFRLNSDPHNCGVPRYNSSCQNNLTVLNLKSGKYYVQAINYNNYTIRLVDAGVQKGYLYVKIGRTKASDLSESCRIELMAMTSLLGKDEKNITFLDIHDELAYGFELSWSQVYCGDCRWWPRNLCIIDEANHVYCGWTPLVGTLVGMVIGTIAYLHLVAIICGTPCVTLFVVHKWRRRHLSMYDTVEEFLQSHNNLMPVRYSYSDVKKMTDGFRVKLGEGGYGSVYKGKLRSGRIAAIKMLSKSKADGQDFINEVATIGRIHHVNVVQLIGFCAKGSKRALVYDFMPNGSLDKYIFSPERCTTLSWKKTYEIAVGVAHGIEYLHRGCDMQILHFDIKPHNILLDENFIPKISDFGLAKLYAVDDSIVSLTAARGTMGYIAPELFYKNIGGVSYKADVYSFGMLLLEMIGRRKNLDPLAEHSSEIYFPFYVYGQIIEGNNVNEVGDATEEDKEMIKKMSIVALWCIQMKPSDRPSMSKVVEMLEGGLESLQVPPKPLLYPEERVGDQTNETESSSALSLVG
ncbi:PREDICTED: rust resistance kinase Lr10 isoform X2 [Theobroma cacao]|uniref:Rust resistance kinase Lr10 isoform X2 n=1 Tax=Theobroma cacao TaxID=3641 RepID=A0AB32W5J0_THECC|nr:PREDICTED: rust resistance kinase Lr10 isoform X2 [Theobroma cacao]